MALAPGTRLGPYEIAAQIGVGGMGEVYRATDTRLKREVALKVLPEALAADADRLARLQREAEVLASLNHPHIAAIYGIEETGASKALVLELVEGPTLADRLAAGAIPPDEALPIATQIAEALEAAHERGIVHRDLKPANVKVRPDGTVKVLDFGLAKAFEPTGAASANATLSPTITSPAMTQAGVILGTAAYMSPEQARGQAADRRSDIWAFGAVLYEMLTGRQAFPGGESVTEALASVLAREPAWDALPADTPREVRRLLERCLRKDPRRRLRDIGDARLDIEDGRSEPAADVTLASQGRRFDWTTAALIAALLATTIALGLRLWLAPAPERMTIQFQLYSPDGTSFTAATTIPRAASSPWPTLSPDGRSIAFAAVQNGIQSIWVHSLETSTARPLRGTEGAVAPFWSPNSDYIGFFADGNVKKVALAGGAPEVVTAWTGLSHVAGAWSAQDVILFSGTGPVRSVPAGGGESTPVTELDASTGEGLNAAPSFLPDGRHFVFIAGARTSAYVGSLDSMERVLLLSGIESQVDYAPSGHLVFIRDGALMAQPFDADRLELTGEPVEIAPQVSYNPSARSGAFTVSAGGGIVYRAGSAAGPQRVRLAWYGRDGEVLEMLGSEAEYDNPALSADDRYVTFERSGAIWWLEISTGRSSIVSSVEGARFPTFAPDGRTIAFTSPGAGGSAEVYENARLGVAGEETVLVRTPQPASRLTWSRGGQLAYVSDGDIWTVTRPSDDSDAPTPSNLTATPALQEDFPAISPNGRWIAFTSNASGVDQVYVASFPDGTGRQPVSSGTGTAPRWKPDGSELYYVAGAELTAVPVEDSDSSISFGPPTARFTVAGDPTEYDIASDGRFLMPLAAEEQASTPVTVILDWAARLEN